MSPLCCTAALLHCQADPPAAEASFASLMDEEGEDEFEEDFIDEDEEGEQPRSQVQLTRTTCTLTYAGRQAGRQLSMRMSCG